MKRAKIPKPKKGAWFVPLRGSYLPASWQGWLLYVPYAYYLVITLRTVSIDANSVSEVVIDLVPYWVAAIVVMTWIAKQKS